MNQGAALPTRGGKSDHRINLIRHGVWSFLLRYFQFFHVIVLKQQKVSTFYTLLIQIHSGIVTVPAVYLTGLLEVEELWFEEKKFYSARNQTHFFFHRYWCFYFDTNLHFLIFHSLFLLGEDCWKCQMYFDITRSSTLFCFIHGKHDCTSNCGIQNHSESFLCLESRAYCIS